MSPRRRISVWGATRVVFLVLLSGACAAAWINPSPTDLGPQGSVLAFTLGVALGELVTLETPQGRPVSAGYAVGTALAVLGQPPWIVAAAVAVGWGLGSLLRVAAGREIHPADVGGRITACAAASGLAQLAEWIETPVLLPSWGPQFHLASLLVAMVVVGLWIHLWEAAIDTAELGVPMAPLYAGLLEHGWPALLAMSASTAMGVMAHSVFGPWTVVLLVLPAVAARPGLHRYAEIRRTYEQTVRSMGRLPELVGGVPDGHGVRVAEMAEIIAREMGLSDREVADLRRACHLHEVAHLSGEEWTDRKAMAAASAAVVREAGNLERVAELIARQQDPYRIRRVGEDLTLPMSARILRTVCEYDRYSQPPILGRSPIDALERLYHNMSHEHDPLVIRELTELLARRGTIPATRRGRR